MYHTQSSKQERLHLSLCSAALRDKGRHRIRPGGSMQADMSSSVLRSELTETADRRTVAPVHLGSFLLTTASCPANLGERLRA